MLPLLHDTEVYLHDRRQGMWVMNRSSTSAVIPRVASDSLPPATHAIRSPSESGAMSENAYRPLRSISKIRVGVPPYLKTT